MFAITKTGFSSSKNIPISNEYSTATMFGYYTISTLNSYILDTFIAAFINSLAISIPLFTINF